MRSGDQSRWQAIGVAVLDIDLRITKQCHQARMIDGRTVLVVDFTGLGVPMDDHPRIGPLHHYLAIDLTLQVVPLRVVRWTTAPRLDIFIVFSARGLVLFTVFSVSVSVLSVSVVSV